MPQTGQNGKMEPRCQRVFFHGKERKSAPWPSARPGSIPFGLQAQRNLFRLLTFPFLPEPQGKISGKQKKALTQKKQLHTSKQKCSDPACLSIKDTPATFPPPENMLPPSPVCANGASSKVFPDTGRLLPRLTRIFFLPSGNRGLLPGSQGQGIIGHTLTNNPTGKASFLPPFNQRDELLLYEHEISD